MTSYNNFIGLDIGKFNFCAVVYGHKKTYEYTNDTSGIQQFLQDYQDYLINALCILETTGGYEMDVLLTLCEQGIAVHRANTRKVKNFIRSYGDRAKTDNLDAKALALYGFERSARLDLFKPQSKKMQDLYELVGRRNDLKQMLIAEKNRLAAPRSQTIQSSCHTMIETLSQEISLITASITTFIEEDPQLTAKKTELKTIPGIGNIIANELVVLLPELGHLNRKQIASLVGLAPRANDSGRLTGYRRTGHGRQLIKPALFLAAMAARKSKSELKIFYENLIKRGKKKMVALVALMRKIIVIANAKLRDLILIKKEI